MADEITVSCFFGISNPADNTGFVEQKNVATESHDQAVQGASCGIMNATVTGVSIPQGEVYEPGLVFVRNLDDTDNIDINTTLLLKPGQWALFWSANSALIATASANTPKLEYRMYDR
jgi:hypothetical protein